MATRVHEAINAVEADGWYCIRQTVSHRQYKHPTRKSLIIIAGAPSDTLYPAPWASVQKQAGT